MTAAAGDIALLISDVDGTLVTHDKVLTSATVAAAASLRAAGVGLALTSARPPTGMRMLIEPLKVEMPIAGFNGGLIVDPAMREIESHAIPAETVQKALQLVEASGLDIWIYTDTGWFVTAADGPHVAREAWIIKMTPSVRAPMTADAAERVFKIVGVSDDLDRVAVAETVVQRRLGDAASATRSEPHFLDITAAEATKGKVVRALSRRLELPASRIATIGDMPNDMLMFRESGLSIAMGNASDAVKAAAVAATDSNEADGWAKAVHRLVLASHAVEAASGATP